MSFSLFVLIAAFLVLILAGLPIAWAMVASSLAWIIATGHYEFLLILPQRLFEGMDVFVLLAIPIFILIGEILNEGKITEKLISVADVYFGWIRGGLAQVNIGTSILFSGITGTAIGDVSALGRIFIPAMTKQGYPASYAAAVTAASSIIGPMVPPSLIIIIYGAATGMSIGALFAACIIPGVLIGVVQMLLVALQPHSRISAKRAVDRSLPAVIHVSRQALIPLLAPLIILVCILSGIATPTEAGAIAACYTILIVLFVYRTCTARNLPGIFTRSMLFSSQLIILIGCGSILSWVMAVENVPETLNAFLGHRQMSVVANLVLFNVFLLVAGMFIDTAAAIILFSPLLLSAATNVGIHPLHFSVIIILNLNIGLLTPPLGICVLTAERMAECGLMALIRAILPFLLVNLIALAIVAGFPELTLYLPGVLGF